MSSATERTEIRAAVAGDADAIAQIYNHFVTHTVVTFEEDTVSPDEMLRRMESVRSAALPWVVAEREGHLIGYAYATKWKERSGYRFSVEATVYLAPDAVGHGAGSALYAALFPLLQQRGIHAVMGGIALPNDASVALHEKFGMRKVAHLEAVGFKFDRWIDVGYWQRVLQ